MTALSTSKKLSKLTWWKNIPVRQMNESDLKVLWSIFNHSDDSGFESYPSRETISQETGLKTRAVQGAITRLIESELIVQERRGRRLGSGDGVSSKYSLARDLFHSPRQAVDAQDAVSNVHTDDTPTCTQTTLQRAPSCPLTDPLSDPLTDPEIDIRSNGEHQTFESGPQMVPSSWHLNGSHVSAASALGLIATDLAGDFKAWAHASGQRSNDWDKRFGELIRLVGEGVDPGIKGFADIEEYISLDPRSKYSYPQILTPVTEQISNAHVLQTQTEPVAWCGSDSSERYALDDLGMSQNHYRAALDDYRLSAWPDLPDASHEADFKARLVASLTTAPQLN